VRESPALDVIRLLEELGADVAFHAPYVPTFREEGVLHEGVALTEPELSGADAVVIVTDHTSVDYQRIVNVASLVIDSRNATLRTIPGRARIVSLSASKPQSPVETPHGVHAGKVVA